MAECHHDTILHRKRFSSPNAISRLLRKSPETERVSGLFQGVKTATTSGKFGWIRANLGCHNGFKKVPENPDFKTLG